MLDLGVARQIGDCFGLGRVRRAPRLAAAGWGAHNTVWRFESEVGLWAVKEIGREPGPQIETAAGLEALAHEQGISSPRPIRAAGGGWLATIEGRTFRCHQWIDGDCPTDSLTAEDAHVVGAALGDLHRLRLPCSSPVCHAWGEAHWLDLAEHAVSLGLGWGPLLRDSIVSILKVEEAAITYAANNQDISRIGSHCDVRPDNTIRTSTRVVLVDWDAAGPVIPGREVAQALRWWSPFEDSFLDGYTSAAGDVDLNEGAGEDGGLLWWLELNVRLALERPDDPDRQQATTWLVNETGSW